MCADQGKLLSVVLTGRRRFPGSCALVVPSRPSNYRSRSTRASLTGHTGRKALLSWFLLRLVLGGFERATPALGVGSTPFLGVTGCSMWCCSDCSGTCCLPWCDSRIYPMLTRPLTQCEPEPSALSQVLGGGGTSRVLPPAHFVPHTWQIAYQSLPGVLPSMSMLPGVGGSLRSSRLPRGAPRAGATPSRRSGSPPRPAGSCHRPTPCGVAAPTTRVSNQADRQEHVEGVPWLNHGTVVAASGKVIGTAKRFS